MPQIDVVCNCRSLLPPPPHSDRQLREGIHVGLGSILDRNSDVVVRGLGSIQEFRSPANPSLHPMYKCGLFSCDGAWGTSQDFFRIHLCSPNHLASWEKEQKECGKDSAESKEDKIQVIVDEERYQIQASRLPWFKQLKKKKKQQQEEREGVEENNEVGQN